MSGGLADGAALGSATGGAGLAVLEAAVHRRLVDDPSAGPVTVEGIAELLRAGSPLAPSVDLAAAAARVWSRVAGLGPIEVLLADPSVGDVLVNGPGPVWVERHGSLTRTDVVLDRATIDLLVERIVAPLGRRVDPACPMVDARLPDGSRVHVVVPPLALDGPCLTIRRFGAVTIGLGDVAPPSVVALLRWAVRARANVVVSGGTGSGKTTLLNALAATIAPGERVITVEDAAELRLRSDHVVRLETRPASVEGVAAVTCRDLVRGALRMRPDRLIVGEVRGGEALDMAQAMNTGHDGSLTTVHANGCEDALRRLETLVLLAGVGLPLDAVRDHLAAAIDLVVHIARDVDGRRRIVEVAEVVPPGSPAPAGAAAGRRAGAASRTLADAQGVSRLPARPPREPAAGAPSLTWCRP